MRQKAVTYAVFAALALSPAVALALTNDEVNRALQFNFSNPGARSLGLGGAFTGLADDATAAYANPAGLTILRKSELSLEARNTTFDTPYASGGEIINNPFSTDAVGEASSSDSVAQVSFASFVYPTERATLSLFYHRVGDFESGVNADPIEFVNANGNPTDQYAPALASISYQVENLGAAVGFKVSDSFSIGASIAYSDFRISSRADRFDGDDIVSTQRQTGSDNAFVYTLGALWQITPQWNLGLAYRAGGDFNYEASNQAFAPRPGLLEFTPSFKVPNVFSAGLAFRPSDAWLFTLDVNRIEYSRLSDGIETVFNTPVGPLSIKDGTEIRLGAEYTFLEMATPLSLRGGVWRDPDHRLAFHGTPPTNCTVDFDNCLNAALYPEGNDETHYSIGLGWAFTQFQLDLAADLSDAVDTYSLSGVWRF